MFLSLVMVTQCVIFMMANAQLVAFAILLIPRVYYQKSVKICSIPSSYREGCIMIICLAGC